MPPAFTRCRLAADDTGAASGPSGLRPRSRPASSRVPGGAGRPHAQRGARRADRPRRGPGAPRRRACRGGLTVSARGRRPASWRTARAPHGARSARGAAPPCPAGRARCAGSGPARGRAVRAASARARARLRLAGRRGPGGGFGPRAPANPRPGDRVPISARGPWALPSHHPVGTADPSSAAGPSVITGPSASGAPVRSPNGQATGSGAALVTLLGRTARLRGHRAKVALNRLSPALHPSPAAPARLHRPRAGRGDAVRGLQATGAAVSHPADHSG